MSSLINIYSLPKKKTLKEDNRLKIYEKVLKMVHHRIKTAANKSDTEDYTFFTIPNVIIGMPRFDTVSCCDYIMTKLSANGFKILNLGPNFIFITWGHIEFSDEKERRMDERIHQLKQGINNVPNLYRNINTSDTLSEVSNHNSVTNNNFRPIYDTPSTEKYLLT